ncbi:unnamed protein product [Caenorhabditis angaria]|uniref:Vacuolar ATPase assembly protein VMA22 n=1 Tax=Caenorhabditis angaria TaxID=860376 RepID=A0A9P1I6U3_9PELO|nr:unnamed protein product [Caenorhabditis angaria]
MSIKDLNELLFDRFSYVNEIMKLRKDLNSKLSLANVCISKAKTTRGISLFSVNSIETHDLEPSVFVNIENDEFKRETEKNEEESEVKNRKSGETEEVKEEKKAVSTKGQFRPFGVLEPTSAKDARQQMGESIDILCRIATIQQKINKIDEEFSATLKHEEVIKQLRKLYV